VEAEAKPVGPGIDNTLTHLSKGLGPNTEQALTLLGPLTMAQRLRLMSLAAALTEKAFGGRVELCAIINALSGRCSEDCRFCSQSARYSTSAATYSLLSEDRVVEAANRAKANGAARFSLVTSGKAASDKVVDQLCPMIERIAGLGLLPCASLGCLAGPALRRLRSAGVDRFHHNLETARSFYTEICTTHRYEERLETLEAARSAGLSLCSGGIFGLGESKAQRIELIEALAELNVESVAVNFINPIPGTPLAGSSRLDAWEALVLLSIIRLLLPQAEIRTCGGRLETLGAASPLQYLAGANATMTGDYLTTQGPRPDQDIAEIEALGLKLAETDRKKRA